MTAVAEYLNSDSRFESRPFKVQKKPYSRGEKKWLAGAFVTPGPKSVPYHENQCDEYLYGVYISIVDPSDGALVDGLQDHLGAIELVEALFTAKSHQRSLPGPIWDINAALATTELPATVQYCTATPVTLYDDTAFQAGFDASTCLVNFAFLSERIS